MAVNEKIRIKIKGYEHAVVDAAAAKIVEAVKRSGAQVSGPIPLPTDKEVITILRAVHKYKDSREQFEMRTHKRLIDVLRPTKETTAALENLELPAGVNIVMEIKSSPNEIACDLKKHLTRRSRRTSPTNNHIGGKHNAKGNHR